MKRSLILASLTLSLAALVFLTLFFTGHFNGRDPKSLPALAVSPLSKSSSSQSLTPDQIFDQLAETGEEPMSSPPGAGPVVEPSLPPGIPESTDQAALGVGKSQFVMRTRWSQLRYLGATPAGAGLNGERLAEAQRLAWGQKNDSTPVVTASHTIMAMMENYFAPLLRRLPRGEDILSRIFVNGSYFSPELTQLKTFDNAFIKGLQSLYIYPSRCFYDATPDICKSKPWLSTGHDPSVIGHELGHVLFNHLRQEKSLEGFQWAAVNEGYADYFSSSYFNEAKVGLIWKSGNTKQNHLRSLLSNLTVEGGANFDDVHNYGVIWGSFLWRVRQKLARELLGSEPDGQFQIVGSPLEAWDGAVLQSISYLGETTKGKVGDAGTALLKSLDALGLGQWKDLVRAELKASQIDVISSPQVTFPTPSVAGTSQSSSSSGGCGVVGGLPSAQGWIWHWLWLLLGCPWIFLNCKVQRSRSKSEFPLEGTSSLWFKCFPQNDPGALGAKSEDGATLSVTHVYFSPLKSTDQGSQVTPILVSDERLESAPSLLVAMVDLKSFRIDQVRGRDGAPFQIPLSTQTVSYETAVAQRNSRYASLFIDGASKLITNQTRESNEPWTITWNGTSFQIPRERVALIGTALYLPRQIVFNGKVVCDYSGTVGR